MASEWKDFGLSEIGRIVTGKTPLTSQSENFGGDIPFITPSDMDDRKTISHTERCLTEVGAKSVISSVIPAGSIIVSCIGSDMGKAAIAGRRSVTNQQINAVVVDEERFDSEFIYYNLSRRKGEIRSYAGGSAQPILNKSGFSGLIVSCPSIETQREIARVLRSLDDKIELNCRMNATLEAMAQALFKSWFVDFDPVKAKALGRIPEGMDADTAALFPSEFVESELGPIPRDWREKTVNELARLNNWTLRNSDKLDTIEYIEISAVNKGNIAEMVVYDRGSEPSRARRRLRHGDTVLSSVRPERAELIFFAFIRLQV